MALTASNDGACVVVPRSAFHNHTTLGKNENAASRWPILE